MYDVLRVAGDCQILGTVDGRCLLTLVRQRRHRARLAAGGFTGVPRRAARTRLL